MMLKPNRTLIAMLLTLALILVMTGCERDPGPLSPAPFPTDAEIFIDGFGPGVQYQAFAGSKVDALDIDEVEVYDGTASLIMTVPGPDYSDGTFAGGAFMTANLRDLSGYDALTFWAKASRSATLNEVGLGNDNSGTSKYVATRHDLPLTTSWKKFIIPIPDPEKLQREGGLFHIAEGHEDGLAYDFWVDELQFEYLGTIAHPTVRFSSTSINAYQNSTISIPTITVTFNVNGPDVDVIAAPAYLNYSSSDSSIVAIDATGTLTALNLGTAVISATLGELAVADSITITVGEPLPGPTTAAPDPSQDAADVVSIYSDSYGAATSPDFFTYWEFSTAEVMETALSGNNMMLFTTLNFAGVDFASQTIDASSMTHFHMDVWTPDPMEAPASFKVLLVDFGADGVYAGSDNSQHEISLNVSTSPAVITDQWSQLDIPLSALSGLTSTGHIAQLVISGDPNTVYVDNIYFYDSGEAPPPPDDEGPQTAAPAPTADADSVISLFSNAYTNVTVDSWATGWEFSTAVLEDIQIAGDDVKLYTNLNFNGIEFTAQLIDASEMNRFHMDIWTPDATVSPAAFLVKLVDFGADGSYAGGDDFEHELSFTASTTPALATGSWVSLDVPMSDFSGLTSRSHLAQMIISASAGLDSVYVDNVYFYVESGGGGSTEGPSSPAPTPTVPADSVISLFSNAYSNVSVDSWATGWEFSTTVLEEAQIAGDDVKLYTELNFNGIEFTTQQIDATEMTRFHMDIWTPDATASPAAFLIKLVDFGTNGSYAGGDDSEHELSFTATSTPALATGTWVSLDVPMSDFAGLTSRAHLAQMIISGDPNTVYVDNVYFYMASSGSGTATAPTTAAPTPTYASGDAISLFSNAYSNVTVDTWSADWDVADLANLQIAGNDVKLYTNLTFAGIEFTSQTIDASNMTHFRVDVWTPDATLDPAGLKIKLVDFGANGSWSGGDDVEHELTFNSTSSPALVTGSWVTFDIPLASFSAMTTREHLAQLIFSGDLSTIYVDNIVLHR